MKRFLCFLLLMMMIAGAAFASQDQQEPVWEDMISEEEVIAIARAEVAKGFRIEESVLDDYGCTITVKPHHDQPYWEICFEEPEDIAQSDRIFNIYTDLATNFKTHLYPNGKIILPVREVIALRMGLGGHTPNELFDEIAAYSERVLEEYQMADFRIWPLEIRAEYSQKVRPKVQAILESGDLTQLMDGGMPRIEVIAQSTFIYGMPDEKSISQEAALALAKAAITESYGVSPDFLEQDGEINVYYDITNASMPLWKFLFNYTFLRPDMPQEDNPYYKVELNAYDGNITYVDAFPYMRFGLFHDLPYHLKHY
ncbi:MAG: PepSY domain-containing protein [Clostridiales bacterium]|nr:PepSY domain-containing protein [Clostridiales bacterium]